MQSLPVFANQASRGLFRRRLIGHRTGGAAAEEKERNRVEFVMPVLPYSYALVLYIYSRTNTARCTWTRRVLCRDEGMYMGFYVIDTD